jgi:hypothetical protein
VSKVFVNIGLSLDGYMAPEGMTMENWDRPEYKDWGAKWGALMKWIFDQQPDREGSRATQERKPCSDRNGRLGSSATFPGICFQLLSDARRPSNYTKARCRQRDCAIAASAACRQSHRTTNHAKTRVLPAILTSTSCSIETTIVEASGSGPLGNPELIASPGPGPAICLAAARAIGCGASGDRLWPTPPPGRASCRA